MALRIARLFALLIAVGLVVSCGSSSEPEPVVIAAPSDQSPLESLIGFSSDPSLRRARIIELQQQIETDIVDCMGAKGFLYTPVSLDQPFLADQVGGDGTRAWADENGLGITRAFLATRSDVAPDQNVDANSAYVRSLDEATALAYGEALFGRLPEGVEGEDISYVPAGCQGDAFAAVAGEFATLDEFEAELDTLNARVEADPRVAGFVREWARCMAERNFGYATPSAMSNDVYARLLEVDAFTDPTAAVDPSSGQLAELIAFERAVAVASFDCEVNLRPGVRSVRDVYERQFIDDNQDLFGVIDAGP